MDDFGELVYRVGGVEQRIALRLGNNPVGRDATNSIRLDVEGVSQQHARVLCGPAGCLVVDLESRNGTFVNGERLASGARRRLQDGDALRFGPVEGRYRAPASAQAAPPAAPPAQPPRPPRPPRQSDGFSLLRPEQILPSTRRSRYMDLLPGVYHTDASHFFNRFLLLFESVLGPDERLIAHLERYFDPRVAPVGMLPWIEAWMRLTIGESLPVERRRALLQRGAELYQWRGTSRGLRSYLQICTGVAPTIVEPGQALPSGYAALAPHVFIVLFEVPEPDIIDRPLVESIIISEKPAHTAFYLDIRQSRAA